MKQLLLIVLHILIAACSFGQGVNKNGKITTNGSEYVNKNGAIGSTDGVNKNGEIVAALTPLQIGDSYQGGIIAYILMPGDPGYDANTQHGLIVATSDQSTGIVWYNNETYVRTYATGTAIGTGSANTTTIITMQGEWSPSYAAGLARAYTNEGYTDWYLPSKDELYKLYLNKSVVNNFITTNLYWSSSETNQTTASTLRFTDGAVYNIQSKASEHAVRAVRSF